jgi:hypothetical protein
MKPIHPKIWDSMAAYPNSKFPVKGISKNGNSEGSMGSKSNLTGFVSVQPPFFLLT